jgi:diaminopimelate epimerase
MPSPWCSASTRLRPPGRENDGVHPPTPPGPLTQGLLRLAKHEAAGNDFLLVADVRDELVLDAPLARWLCDRHLGVGADGVIRVASASHGAPVSMQLRNADGSAAELSGNGLRCLAQLAVTEGLVETDEFDVWTVAGLRRVAYEHGAGTPRATTEMGAVRLGPAVASPVGDGRARLADVGNPHLVIEVPSVEDLDLAAVGPAVEAGYPQGINVEFVVPVGEDRLALRVWERGVGETLACGSGTCAAAAAAHAWGLVGDRVDVVNPGGVLSVELGTGEGVLLSGPVRKVADVLVDLEAARLGASALEASAARAGVPVRA